MQNSSDLVLVSHNMTYTLTNDPGIIVRDEDGAFIPMDPSNVDYQVYLAWVEEGNEPNPAPGIPTPPIEDVTPTIEELAEATADQEQRIQALENQMATFQAELKQISERLTPRVKGAK